MDQTIRNEDLIDSELSAEVFLAKARNAGNRMPSSVMVTNVATSETISEDDKKDSAEAVEPLSSNCDALTQQRNQTFSAYIPQSRPGAYGSAPGRAESSRIKGALTAQPETAKQIDNLSLTNSIASITKSDAASQDIATTRGSGLPNPLGQSSKNVPSTVDELHLQSRARKEAKKTSGGTFERMHERVMTQKLAQNLGIVAAGSDVVVGVKEVCSRFLVEEEMEIAPRVQDLNLGSSQMLNSAQSTLTLAIAAEVVDDNHAFMEAQIQERMNWLRDEMVRDTVQADAVKVIAERELRSPKRRYGCWLTLFLIFISVGVTLAVVLSRQSNDPQTQPLQYPLQPICTLCLDGSTVLKNPDRQLPRQTEGFTCGSVASNHKLVTELLVGSSGNCSADVQIYGQYCGCPSIAENDGEKCNFCRFGLHPSKDLSTPVYNDSCVELANFVSSLSGELCSANSATDILACGAYCKCPSSIPTCSLCPIFTDTPLQLWNNVSLFNMTCRDLNAYVSIFTADQCTSYQDDLREAAGICGCPPLSCSLCQSDNLQLPDISILSRLSNYSCAELNGIIGGFSKEDCTASHALIAENNEQCCIQKPPGAVLYPSFLTSAPSSPSMSGTPSMAPSFSCSLCPEGVSPPNPDQVLSKGDTCGELSYLANGLSFDECILQKDVLTRHAVSCGCS